MFCIVVMVAVIKVGLFVGVLFVIGAEEGNKVTGEMVDVTGVATGVCGSVGGLVRGGHVTDTNESLVGVLPFPVGGEVGGGETSVSWEFVAIVGA